MNFDCLLMSDSELLRIKNKQKASYKSRKTARSNLKILIRPNDRFGFMCEQSVVYPLFGIVCALSDCYLRATQSKHLMSNI